uniref:Uncharacterized protein n=1 Tax=Leptocylindrus danicus TaxID=163516 RepID=A0A7S2KTN2_9STRA|mmetsp:Transcript_26029/g.38820  ORF Transcript_26029/g.38820 Transcript_26029/m.38820 type:complete len:120 (+) Transcript_26029:192-551(+)
MTIPFILLIELIVQYPPRPVLSIPNARLSCFALMPTAPRCPPTSKSKSTRPLAHGYFSRSLNGIDPRREPPSLSSWLRMPSGGLYPTDAAMEVGMINILEVGTHLRNWLHQVFIRLKLL